MLLEGLSPRPPPWPDELELETPSPVMQGWTKGQQARDTLEHTSLCPKAPAPSPSQPCPQADEPLFTCAQTRSRRKWEAAADKHGAPGRDRARVRQGSTGSLPPRPRLSRGHTESIVDPRTPRQLVQ